MTYHRAGIIEELYDSPHWDKVKRFTYCEEKEGEHIGSHIYLEFWKQVDHGLDNWYCADDKCDASPNTATGSGWRVACDRGHFYVACEFKKAKVRVVQNWYPLKDYLVRTNWVHVLWQQGKVEEEKVRDCAAYYKCLTKSFDDSLRVCRNWADEQRVAEKRTKRRKWTTENLGAWKPKLEAIKEWEQQYHTRKHRYDFLWLWSSDKNTKFGKSKYIEAQYKTFTHKGKINWTGYDDDIHNCILFDDVKDIESFVYENKIFFQGSCDDFTIGESATMMYARQLYCADKKIVICANNAPSLTTKAKQPTWLSGNCRVVECVSPLF